MRYIAEYIRPASSKPALGSRNVLIRHYANDRNAFRFMHKHLISGHYESGQYILSSWPDGTFTQRHIGFLWKGGHNDS